MAGTTAPAAVVASLWMLALAGTLGFASATNTTCTTNCDDEKGVEMWVTLLIVAVVIIILVGMAYALYQHHMHHQHSSHNAKHHMLTHHGKNKARRSSIADVPHQDATGRVHPAPDAEAAIPEAAPAQ